MWFVNTVPVNPGCQEAIGQVMSAAIKGTYSLSRALELDLRVSPSMRGSEWKALNSEDRAPPPQALSSPHYQLYDHG
ncbi:hypothetical protein ACQP3L_35685, partial [Escherichia coli]